MIPGEAAKSVASVSFIHLLPCLGLLNNPANPRLKFVKKFKSKPGAHPLVVVESIFQVGFGPLSKGANHD
jgi:hypothetical protein